MDLPTNCTPSKENDNANTVYYGVYVPNEAKDYTVDPNVFEDKLEALKVAKKNKKSRFKAFQFYHEAAEFAVNGSEFPMNSAAAGLFTNKESECTQAVGEKASPFKGPKPQELVELRKQIEIGNFKLVRDTIWQNPRYLVSSGDTPSILQEGPRYNALHVAAKSRNAEITELILTTVSNVKFIKLLYGDENQQNAEDRTAVLLDLYLNTPNKGLNETPLHFASKHGAAEVVEILVSYSQCDKTLKNKFNKTAEEIICERAECDNLPAIKKKIQMLLRDSYYVPVLRAEDKSMPPLIGEPFSPTQPPVFNYNPLSPRLEIHAYAGPMDQKGAREFRKIWKTPPRSLSFNSPKKLPGDIVNVSSLRFKDPDKGLERIGNKLANKYDVNWKEYWPFLGCFVDISSKEGLTMLENHLANRCLAFNDISMAELKKSFPDLNPDLNQSDILSPISNLCQAFSTFHINDSSRSFNFSPERKTDVDSITYIDKACQVFANRISNDILRVLYSEENILQTLEIEIKQLELLMTSYMEDDRFFCINFQKVHARLGLLVGQKLYNNIKEEVRVFLCGKMENDLDVIMKSVDCFSSDDESHNFKEISEVKKPTIYKKQVICLIHFILNVLSQNYELKQTGNDEDCVRDWENAEACSCIYHVRKSKRNSLSRSGSFKKMIHKNEADGIAKRLYYDDIGEQNLAMNGLNTSLNHSYLVFSSDEESGEEEDTFYTPPSSPDQLMKDSDSEDEFNDTELPKHDIYIESDYPTKLDLEVFNAINYTETKIDRSKYPNVYKWFHSVSLYDKNERERWPSWKPSKNDSFNLSLDNNSFCVDSPKTSTPSKSWLRITGTNSPKAVFKSNSLRH